MCAAFTYRSKIVSVHMFPLLLRNTCHITKLIIYRVFSILKKWCVDMAR
uniref:Uncharacterized protein n=1 Tax=Setaria italica TaxID=4555 RepID=K3XU95_SETIT